MVLRGLADSHKGSLDERRRCHRTEGAKKLYLYERRTILQNAWWGLVQMCGARRSPEKVERST